MGRRYRDREWLERAYQEDGRTQREIAEECDVSPRTIRKYMNRFGIETREIAGENHPLYGKERSEETKEKISEALRERTFSKETRQRISAAQHGRELPKSTREKISVSLSGIVRSEETRRRMSESTSGPKNPNWRGGRSDRYGAGWSIVREHIVERDRVCQNCGHDGSRHQLDVHHIVPVRRFREIDEIPVEDAHCEANLVLLCKPCHGLAENDSISVTAPSGRIFENERS